MAYLLLNVSLNISFTSSIDSRFCFVLFCFDFTSVADVARFVMQSCFLPSSVFGPIHLYFIAKGKEFPFVFGNQAPRVSHYSRMPEFRRKIMILYYIHQHQKKKKKHIRRITVILGAENKISKSPFSG